MISEFDLLSDKISKLVQLAQTLRQQNAELRQQIEAQKAELHQQIEAQKAELHQQIEAQKAEMHQQIDALSADKASLAARMSEAHDRMAAVLEQLPAPEPEPAAEQPEEPHDEEVA
jgi:DNA anti-recombination protein RmuC